MDDAGNVVLGKHATFVDLLQHGAVDEETLRGYRTAMTVRNPFDSLYSAWFKKKYSYVPLLDDPSAFIHRLPGFVTEMEFVREHTFSEWVIENYRALGDDGQKRHLYGRYLHYTDTVLRFEHLQQDLADFLEACELPDIGPVPVTNVTEGREKSYQEHYTDEARELIATVYCLDLERFGYEF